MTGSSPVMTTELAARLHLMIFLSRYQALIETGEIERDSAQEDAARAIGALEQRLATHRLARKSSSLGWVFGRSEKKQPPLKGLYLHGDVGRGKTMLMDLFFEASPVHRKRRAHFHEFMVDVHERINGFRQKISRGELSDPDPIKPTAQSIFDEAWLLCFDEFHVTDIADAMILGRLFTRLFELGTVVVATSNVAPDDLYKNGLNRALFLPFIKQIHGHMETMRLSARTDFRLEKLAGTRVWHVPADAEAGAALDAAFVRLTGGAAPSRVRLTVNGRKVDVPRAARGVARFSFDDLCEQPLGGADYLKIAHEFHTVIVDRVPVLSEEKRGPTKRFITLIDTFYDNAVKLVASASAEPTTLYQGDGLETEEFRRTASRLIEMGSETYLALPHGRRDSAASGDIDGLVET
jgi:cell division protein ZapE